MYKAISTTVIVSDADGDANGEHGEETPAALPLLLLLRGMHLAPAGATVHHAADACLAGLSPTAAASVAVWPLEEGAPPIEALEALALLLQ